MPVPDRHPTYRLGPDFEDKLNRFVSDFLGDGFDLFKKEFEKIDDFVDRACCDRSERDDHELRKNPKEKYLLELVSFKIYDQLNREEFNRRRRTLIVLPDCLSIHDQECEKVETSHGFFCRKCQPTCQAYQVVELAARFGVKVVFSKRKLAQQLTYFAERENDLGVIGIACLMMLADGMRTAADVGIPARGVLLNFTGCEHWNDLPFASEFTMSSLRAILEEKYGKRD